MFSQRAFRHGTKSFASLLNYFALVADGVLLNKDGSLMSAFYYQGPDRQSISAEQLEQISLQLNNSLNKLGKNWLLHVHCLRTPSLHYPLTSRATHPTCQLIEQNRKDYYTTTTQHYTNRYSLTLTYYSSYSLSPATWFSSQVQAKTAHAPQLDQALTSFQKKIRELLQNLQDIVSLTAMDSTSLLNFLHFCISGEDLPLQQPDPPAYLDQILGAHPFTHGLTPKIGSRYLKPVAITAFPDQSTSNMLHTLQRLPFSYSICHRFIFKEPWDAQKEIKKIRTRLHNKQLNFFELVLQAFTSQNKKSYTNTAAQNQAEDAHHALQQTETHHLHFGYYTLVVLLSHQEESQCHHQALQLCKTLSRSGFLARIEEVNATEAYLGCLPGNNYANIRKPLIHTRNLTHLLPLTDTWQGQDHNPNPLFPPHSSALCYVSTTEHSPFFLNIHVSDIGHSFVIGPTGSGKSTLLAFLSTQFLRYPDARIFFFDQGNAQYGIAKACGAGYFDILSQHHPLTFCPLHYIDQPGEEIWACSWLEELLTLQGITFNPTLRHYLAEAVHSLTTCSDRTLSALYTHLQEPELKQGLASFTTICQGTMAALFDAQHQSTREEAFQLFEIYTILSKAPCYHIPALTYLFHHVERQLGTQPALIVIDEAWSVLANSLFKEKLKEWLKTLRKKNTAVIFATQSLSDITESSLCQTILESCPSKFFLANSEAQTPAYQSVYQQIGLTTEQIHTITTAQPKRHYYYISPAGNKLIDLMLDPASLAFFTANSKQKRHQIDQLEQQYGKTWPYHWLHHLQLTKQAALWHHFSQSC